MNDLQTDGDTGWLNGREFAITGQYYANLRGPGGTGELVECWCTWADEEGVQPEVIYRFLVKPREGSDAYPLASYDGPPLFTPLYTCDNADCEQEGVVTSGLTGQPT